MVASKEFPSTLGSDSIVQVCCQDGFALDLYYNCVVSFNCKEYSDLHFRLILYFFQDDSEKNFLKLLNGLKQDGTRVSHYSSEAPFSCEMSRRKEFEVISIPKNTDKMVYVITNATINDIIYTDDYNMEDNVKKTKYECLTSDETNVIAVVCDEEENEVKSNGFIKKCCDKSESLSEDLKCIQSLIGLPPRAIMSPITMHVVGGGYKMETVSIAQCSHEFVIDTVQSVTTDGRYLSATHDIHDFHCVDTINYGANSSLVDANSTLVAVICLDKNPCPNSGKLGFNF